MIYDTLTVTLRAFLPQPGIQEGIVEQPKLGEVSSHRSFGAATMTEAVQILMNESQFASLASVLVMCVRDAIVDSKMNATEELLTILAAMRYLGIPCCMLQGGHRLLNKLEQKKDSEFGRYVDEFKGRVAPVHITNERHEFTLCSRYQHDLSLVVLDREASRPIECDHGQEWTLDRAKMTLVNITTTSVADWCVQTRDTFIKNTEKYTDTPTETWGPKDDHIQSDWPLVMEPGIDVVKYTGEPIKKGSGRCTLYVERELELPVIDSETPTRLGVLQIQAPYPLPCNAYNTASGTRQQGVEAVARQAVFSNLNSSQSQSSTNQVVSL